jgi:hypothetical protein
MGFWNKLGKIALTAAPYVAAPFTGGASLAFAPMSKQAVGAWSASDARKNAAKGLAPSSFDRYLGLAGDVAGGLSSAGALGKFGAGKYGGTSSGSSWQDKLGGILGGGNKPYIDESGAIGGRSRFGGGYAGNYADSDEQQYPSGSSRSGGGISRFIDRLGGAKGISAIAGGVGGALALKKILGRDNDENPPADENYGPQDMGTSRFQRRMKRQLGPVMGQANQNNPNLALSIGQGRMDAMRDQPFRRGYDVRTTVDYDENDQPINEYTPMPRIGPGRRRGNRGYRYQEPQESATY